MAKTNQPKVFKTLKEYSEFYSADISQRASQTKSNYYRIGEGIAQMASECATNEVVGNLEGLD
ncbi:MAG: hypothetical protein L6Q71_11045 [Planctomycetes bacterium]|nr:hypothetical protein [Planctomycetota bacterium]NUQ33714.1 hypothetical protein [Planctomycetaceae bacterium]